MQFIGIKDIERVDLYESDIVSRIEVDCWGESESIYKIIFKEYSFCLEVLKSNRFKLGAIVSFMDEIKKTGNIYES